MNPPCHIRGVLSLIILTATLAGPVSRAGVEAQVKATRNTDTTDFVLIITGGELLSGLYTDSHTQFITRTLVPLGCRCVASLCVGDKPQDLQDALIYAKQHAPLIIVTGGLGPTDDDITRKVVSEVTGIELSENPEVLSSLLKRFAGSGRELPANLRRQALTPVKGTYLPNPSGTAAGLIFNSPGQVVVALPGPPRELRPMLTNELVPYLSKRFGIHSVGTSLQMRFVGIGESSIDQTIEDYLKPPADLMISSLFEAGRVDLTFSLPGNTAADKALLKELERQLLVHLGQYMYADDGSTLEEQVVRLLAKTQITLALAEVGSGGSLAASLGDVPEASRELPGAYVAASNANMALVLRLPARETSTGNSPDDSFAKLIAARVSSLLGSRWGLAVTEPYASAEDRSSVWTALSKGEGNVSSKQIYLRGQGQAMRNRLVSSLLDMIRRELLKETQSTE